MLDHLLYVDRFRFGLVYVSHVLTFVRNAFLGCEGGAVSTYIHVYWAFDRSSERGLLR